MPVMTNQQRIDFLKHVHSKIFSRRFPMDVQPGTQRFAQLVPMFQEEVKKIQLDPMWNAWTVEQPAKARTFKCAELGAYILIGFDVTLNIDEGQLKLRIIEQNPHKKGHLGELKETAILARRGHNIAWIIDNTSQNDNKFLGKMQDGEFIPNKPRAYEKVTPMRNVGASIVETEVRQDQYGTNYQNLGDDWLSDIPIIDPNDILGVV